MYYLIPLFSEMAREYYMRESKKRKRKENPQNGRP